MPKTKPRPVKRKPARRRHVRTIENPNVPLSDPTAWLLDAMGATPTKSGIRVNLETALTYSPIWRGVSDKSAAIAKTPLQLYRRTSDGGKERATEHPAWYLMRRKPSMELHSFFFLQTLTGHLLLVGNGYAYINRRGDGTPMELLPLNPQATYADRLPDGVTLVYKTVINGKNWVLLPDNVLHVRGLSFDGITGFNMVSKGRDSMGLGLAAEQFGETFFANGAAPSIALKHPGVLGEDALQHIRRDWAGGIGNVHKPAILEEGMDLAPLSNNAKDSQLIEVRQHQLREAANWVGVPAHRLGDTILKSYNSVEQENIRYLEDLDPVFVAWESECWDKLLTEEQKRSDTHFFEFERKALIRMDANSQIDSIRKQVDTGLATLNEGRGVLNMPRIADALADKARKPVNIGYIDDPTAAQTTNAPEPSGDMADQDAVRKARVKSAQLDAMQSALSRMMRRVGEAALREARKPDTFCDYLDSRIVQEQSATVLEVLRPIVGIAEAEHGRARMSDVQEAFFSSLRARLLTATDAKPAQLEKGVERSLGDWQVVDTPNILELAWR